MQTGSPGNGGFGGGGGGGDNIAYYANWLSGHGGGGAGLGGAIFNNGGTLIVFNSTFAANTAQGGAGWPSGHTIPFLGNVYAGSENGSGFGGAIFSRNGAVVIDSSTFSGNTAAAGSRTDTGQLTPPTGGAGAGGGLYVLGDGATVTVIMNNTILANTLSGPSDFQANQINSGTFALSGTGNLIENPGSAPGVFPASGIVSSAAPLLAPLASNGGPTQTMALLLGSPALNSGDASMVIPPPYSVYSRYFVPAVLDRYSSLGPPTDQRGFLRVNLTPPPTVDIGAYQHSPPNLWVEATAPDTVVAGTNLVYTITLTNTSYPGGSVVGDAQDVVLLDTLPAGTTFVNQKQLAGPTFTLSQSGNQVSDTIAILPAGSVATFMIEVNVPVSTATNTLLSNTSTATINLLPYNIWVTGTTVTSPPPVPSPPASVAASSVTLTVSPAPATFGQTVTLTATVTLSTGGVPTGTVTFFNGVTALGTITLDGSGTATLTTTGLPPGTLALTATYSGDATFAASASVSVSLQVFQQHTLGGVDPTTGIWYLANRVGPSAPDAGQFAYGAPDWFGLVGDWLGTGQRTVAVVDPTTETWYVRLSNTPGAPDFAPFQFGAPGWIPVAGDWTGTGHDGIGVFDPGTGTWYLRNEIGPGAPDAGTFAYGAPGWLPVVGHWAGGSEAGIGVIDPSTEIWYLRNTPTAGVPDIQPFAYGAPGWTPVVGDWGGTGQWGIGVFDPSGTWYIRHSASAGAPDVTPFAYGMGGWTPLAGSWQAPPPAAAAQDRVAAARLLATDALPPETLGVRHTAALDWLFSTDFLAESGRVEGMGAEW